MDLVPVLRMLEKQDPTDVLTWETRYVLLVWLSIISKIPFPLSRLETSDDVTQEDTITNRYNRKFISVSARKVIISLFCCFDIEIPQSEPFYELIMHNLSFSITLRRILKMCKLYCLSKDACSVAAVFLIANFLNRSDVKKLYLEEIINWACEVIFLIYWDQFVRFESG